MSKLHKVLRTEVPEKGKAGDIFLAKDTEELFVADGNGKIVPFEEILFRKCIDGGSF